MAVTPSYVDIAIDVAPKDAQFLRIGILALCQERTIFIVSKFEYTKYIGSRQDKLKPIYSGIPSEWYAVFVSFNFIV